MNSPHHDSAIDMEVIASLRALGGEDDPELLFELIDLFLDDAPNHISALESAAAAGDVETIERAAHTLKSSCANIGARQLSALCRELESQGRARDLGAVPTLVERARTEYLRVQDALEAIKS